MNTLQKAQLFKDLHDSNSIFIMANAWNAGSAILLQEAGIKAIGTTSAGIAYSHALPDYASALPFDTALSETQKIASACDLPVSMDAENGYAHSSQAVYDNIKRIATSGVVGASIEDYTGDKNKPLYDTQLAIERIQAAKEAVKDLGYPFILTARAECYLTKHPKAFAESMDRILKYQQAGADCLFIPGISDIKTIQTFTSETTAPLSVVMGLNGNPISVNELEDAGVSRISIGGSLARATMGLVRHAAKEMLNEGTFNFSSQQIEDSELCQLFKNHTSMQ